MKIAQYKTSKVRWALDYNEAKIEAGTAARIGGNVAGRKDAVERIFNHFAFQRESSGLKNRFIHLKLSLSPLDKDISSKTFRKITGRVLQSLGMDNNPFNVYRHYDTEHPHVHVVVSRITFDGQLVRDSFDGLRIKRIEETLEKEFNLTPSWNRILSPKGVRMQQKWERERSEKSGVKSVRNYIQCGVIESLHGRPSLTVFVKRLERRGINIWHREFHRNSQVYHGLSYALDPAMLKIRFNDDSPFGLAGGIDPDDVNKFSNQNPVTIEHRYFGTVVAQLISNSRGIPELCLDGTKPDGSMKPYSFRAANLGPFFQFDSIVSHLSQIDLDTLEFITLRTNKKTTAKDYERIPLTENENEAAKLILAAELKSRAKVDEALKDGIRLQSETLDRACTEEETKFIHLLIEANAQRSIPDDKLITVGIDNFSNLILQFNKISKQPPTTQTIRAIRLISEKNWSELQSMLADAMASRDRTKAPLPDIMFLGIPTSLSLVIMDYQLWYQNADIEMTEDEGSAKRRNIEIDTANLLGALKEFDEPKVRQILLSGEPDVTVIPLEHLGKITAPNLFEVVRKRLNENEPKTGNKTTVKNNVEVKQGRQESEEEMQHKEKGYEIA